jgi:lambda family phage portal protein
MKRNILDKAVGFFSPKAELRRLQARAARDMLARAYDAAQTYPTSDWISASANSANGEIKAAQTKVRERARDLARNNPYAVRALNVIVANTVGTGIVANIKGRSKLQEKKLNDLWKLWAETTACDYSGRNNFYGLQALVLRTMAESGEGLSRKTFDKDGPKLQILESDYLVTDKDDTATNLVQGVEFDRNGKRVAYHLYVKHPGDNGSGSQTIRISAEDLDHVYRQDRPGQVRGISWAHAIIEPLKDLDDYQRATLVGRKVASCFGVFVRTNGQDIGLTDSQKRDKREAQMQLTPGTVRYLDPGEDIQLASPPGVDGYTDFVREQLRAVASGLGITYERLTGDFSQVNFSSGRMGDMEFRRNVDFWRWNILVPQFCEPSFALFKRYAEIQGISTDGITVEWVPPAHVMIDPAKEVAADKEAVKAGFKSRSQVIREQGYDPESVLNEIKDEREAALKAGVTFDTDIPAKSAESNGDKKQDGETNQADDSAE